MKPRAIHTEEEHRQALARIDQLMDAKPGTDDADELDLWVTLVSVYEDQHYPIDPPDPIEALKFRMEQQGLRQKDLIPYIGSASKVSEVLTGKRPLSLSMIRRLHQELGIPADVLLGDRRPTTALSAENVEWDCFPLGEMIKRTWINFKGSAREAKDKAEELVRSFIHPFGDELLMPTPTRNRQHVRHGGKTDPYALFAWRIQVMHLAQAQEVNDYRLGSVGKDLTREVAKLSYFNDGPSLAQELLAKCGIHLVTERHLSKTYLDGACMLMPDGKPLIALTLRYDRLDNFWFTLAHELAHVARHLLDADQSFFDDIYAADELSQEKEADQMACDGLIPGTLWRAAHLLDNPQPAQVRKFAEELRINPAIPAGRIRHETRNFAILNSLLGNGCVRNLFQV
jgi:HTH-type transcriptional regulator / antitoxin HigA